jgi:hypothetical protein
VTKYNCKKRQQRRRMLQQYIKQEEACDDRRSNSPALDSSPRLPYPKALSAAATASQDQLTGESKSPDQAAEAAAAAARLPLPKVVVVNQNRNDVSPQGGYSPWYNKPSSHRQWTATTKPFNHRKRQQRRKLPQQQQQQIIKQEAYTGLQSPPLDARLPYSRPMDTQDPLPASERKQPQDLMAGGAASPPSPKADENHFVLSPPAEAPWARNRCQEGAYVPHIPR